MATAAAAASFLLITSMNSMSQRRTTMHNSPNVQTMDTSPKVSEEAVAIGVFLIKLIMAIMVSIVFFFILCKIIKRIRKAIASKTSKRLETVTQLPIIRFPQEDLYVPTGNGNMENVIPEARIKCSCYGIERDLYRHQEEVPIEQMTIRYCQKLQKHVMIGLKTGIVIHQEWDKDEQIMMNEECQICTKLLNNEEPSAYSSLSLA